MQLATQTTTQPIAHFLSFRSTSNLIPIALELLDKLPQINLYVFPPTGRPTADEYAWKLDWKLVLLQSEPFSAEVINSIKSRSERLEIITHRAIWEKSDISTYQKRYRFYNLNHWKAA